MSCELHWVVSSVSCLPSLTLVSVCALCVVQEWVRRDIVEWLRWLKNSIGFDGWRFDYVRGWPGHFAKQYIDETTPEMAFGEYWDACSYSGQLCRAELQLVVELFVELGAGASSAGWAESRGLCSLGPLLLSAEIRLAADSHTPVLLPAWPALRLQAECSTTTRMATGRLLAGAEQAVRGMIHPPVPQLALLP